MRLKTFLGWSGAKKDIKETPKVEETQTAGFFKSVVVVVAAVVAGGNNVVVVEAEAKAWVRASKLKCKDCSWMTEELSKLTYK